ncbi:glycoside hydrolase family 95 protein [Schizopora paradoxa]|uniref:Glycoside hydrolase family 95 protein n=1 Tax=Schizopora paradoxa TaxID=27342 RepID=A0A0H2RUV8_9AGAM|nr:glycoside hydrolase family 95 protein [Schizopora paradoxa]
MRQLVKAAHLLLLPVVWAAPSGFPSSGNGLWYTETGSIWSRHFLPIGNGFLAAMTPGGTTQEMTQLNIESLWSGGPFADPTYNGGNKLLSEKDSTAAAMQTIRQEIFESPNGTIEGIDVLTTDQGAYGSYSGAGYLLSTLNDFNASGNFTDYGRFLDLDHGIAKTLWSSGGEEFSREAFCSFPAKACISNTSTSSKKGLSQTYAFSALTDMPAPNVTCFNNSTLRLVGLVADPGMAYELLATVRSSGGSIACSSSANLGGGALTNATITVDSASSASITWVGGTNYDMNAGDATHNFSFLGVDPHEALVAQLKEATSKTYSELLTEHQTDVKAALYDNFALDLGQKPDLETPTDVLRSQYEVDTGNPYLEWVLFNYGRYLLASSARGDLPANLQGKWAFDASNPWSGDYHANINLQMNYWFAETTNMNVSASLFNYMQKTWAPRGAYTANVLYNISQGWVTHDEMNIFGHTGMKAGEGSAEWADFPESNAWMMFHVWDHFDFTNDLEWWKSQGYPLLKSVAQFHVKNLRPDSRFNDGSLVVAPCNSPEQPPITLACANSQQLIWQLFNAVEKGAKLGGETDAAFLDEITNARSNMDKGVHVGSWGQLQEWKVDMDQPNDTHRHLSHLVGLYPGYALANFEPSLQNGAHGGGVDVDYTRQQVLDAAQVSLIHRGNGTGPDADSGWEKVWRAACWAQFANASEFYHELTYALQRNFAENLFSIYDPFDADPIIQIDANFGFPSALMNALIQTPDVADSSLPLEVTLLPALPPTWPSGSIRGARVRGAISLDMTWTDGKPTKVALKTSEGAIPRTVNVLYKGQVKATFNSKSGESKTISSF